MSMIFVMACFVLLIASPNISQKEVFYEQANATSEIVNRTTTSSVVLTAPVSDVFGGMLTILIWGFFFILAIFVFYFIMDTMKFFGRTAEEAV